MSHGPCMYHKLSYCFICIRVSIFVWNICCWGSQIKICAWGNPFFRNSI